MLVRPVRLSNRAQGGHALAHVVTGAAFSSVRCLGLVWMHTGNAGECLRAALHTLPQVQGGGNCANALTAAARLGLRPTIVSKVRRL